MSLQDSLFQEVAEEDLQHFLKSEQRKRVLLFPPVNNYRRFLIHQLVQDRFGDLLQTFSIGRSFARRTVVCYKSDFIGPPQVNGESLHSSDSVTGKSTGIMGIESQCTPSASPEHSTHKPRQVKSAPAVEIYRPPAARRARLEKSPAGPSPVEQTSTDACPRVNRQKRPDRAVYVPRHRRGASEVEVSSNVPVETQSKPPRETHRTNSRPPIDRTPSAQAIPKEPLATIIDSIPEKMDVQTAPKETLRISSQPPIEQASPKKVTAIIDSTLEKMAVQSASIEIPTPVVPIEEKMDQEISENTVATVESAEEKMEEDIKLHDCIPTSMEESLQEKNTAKTCSRESPVCFDESDKRDRRKLAKTEDSNGDGVETQTSVEVLEPCDSSVVQTEISLSPSQTKKPENKLCDERDNNKVFKQVLVSKVLVISDKEPKSVKPITSSPQPLTPVKSMTPPERKVKKIERPKSKPAPPPLPPSKINRDECDWDSLFDDNGDCLDPTLIEELTSSVGEVVIEKPKSSYKAYTKPIEVSSDEFAHVLEIYNFPSEFKSSDLAAVFSPFKSGGFELKWVDDTHCLGVFSSPLVAAEVLASDHPFVKTRPLSEATALSKTKARRSSEFLQPYRTRPETCAALARRLVTKSLGVTLATARQEREREKIVLREAKEKKRLANKQREDVWEGIIAEKPSS